MSTENVLCRAEIKLNSIKFTTLCSIILGICVLIFTLIVIPVRQELGMGGYPCGKNVFGDTIALDWGYGWKLLLENALTELFIVLSVMFLSLIIFIIGMLICSGAKKCQLSLTKDGINGFKKGLSNTNAVDLPFENVTSISVKNGVLDKIFGGETVAIASATGFIRFMCVQNAKEFVDKTLLELKKYKESVASKPTQQTVVNNSSDEADKLMKLKKLLKQGLISQEEFEQKRKELISRM